MAYLYNYMEDDEKTTALLKQVSEQEKEIAALTKINDTAINTVQLLKQEKEALTEQVEKLKAREKEGLEYFEINSLTIGNLKGEVERLREREKELVEALREANKRLDDDGHHELWKKIQSLLSKFEVPNQS